MRLFCLSDTIIRTFVMVVLAVAPVAGQTPFVKFYPQGESSDVIDAISLSPERLVLAGYEFIPATNNFEPRVLTLDANGEVIKNECLPTSFNQSVKSIVRLSDDSFCLGISPLRPWDTLEHWKTYRMSTTSGQLEGYGWSSNATSVIIESSVALPGGDVVSVGSIRSSDLTYHAFIVREGAGGRPVFQELLDLPPRSRSYFNDIKLMGDGSLLVLGVVTRGDRGVIVLNFEPDGTLRWSRRYVFENGPNADNASLALLTDNAFAFSIIQSVSSFPNEGIRSLIVRCDAEGMVQQATSYGNTIDFTVSDLLPKPDGNLFLVGATTFPGTVERRGLIVEVDPSGIIVRRRIYLAAARTYFQEIRSWNNGQGYYLIGSGIGDECQQNYRQMMIVSVDEELNPPAGHCLDMRDFEVITKEIEVTIANEVLGMETTTFPMRPVPDFVQTPAFSSDLICLNLEFEDSVTTDTFCYREEIALDRTISVMNDVGITLDSITISLSGPGQGDYLFLPEGPAFNLRGQNSDQLAILPTTALNAQELPVVIRGLRFGNADAAPETGLRMVTINIYYGCEKVETISFPIFVYGLATSVPGFPTDSVLCPGDSLLLNAAMHGAAAYRWSTGGTDSVLLVTEAGTYAVEITGYCKVDTFTVSVTEALIPELADREEFLFICLGDSVQFRPSLTPDIEMAWADGFPMADRFFAESGTYQLIQSTACGEGVITVDAVVQNCCKVYLPNAFSPNGDGVNDRLVAFPGLDDCRLATNFRLKVYDRWGGLAFRGDGKEEGWDGTIAGILAKAGTYVFVLNYFNGETEIELAGSVALLR